MANKTISLPDDVVPIIDSLEEPFSAWVANQLRRFAAEQSEASFGQQLLTDATLADRPTPDESKATLDRMERSAPW